MERVTNTNPWSALPEGPPFILPQDAAHTRAFNAKASESHRLRVEEHRPEPYLGDPNAPIVVLGNNPGFTEEGARLKREPAFAPPLVANLRHEPSDYPFVFLAPDIPGRLRQWWERKLRDLLDFGPQVLCRSILAIEYFPYPSRQYGAGLPRLSSQDYSFGLVRKAIERKAVIVLMRGKGRWLRAVPALTNYEGLCELRSPQAGTISRKNCARFNDIVRALKAV